MKSCSCYFVRAENAFYPGGTRSESGHRDGHESVYCGPITQLTPNVPAAAPYRAAAQECTRISAIQADSSCPQDLPNRVRCPHLYRERSKFAGFLARQAEV